MATEPHEGIDPYANPESRAAEGAPTAVSRAGSSGTAAPTSAPADEQPDQAVPGGTSGGDPLAGVGMTQEDSAEAVSGDTGPEHPGERRS